MKRALDIFLNRSTFLKHKAMRVSAARAEMETAFIDVCLPIIPFLVVGTDAYIGHDHDTALIFAYIERIFLQEDRKVAVESSISTLEGFLPKLRDVGFTDMVLDESFEIPRDLIRGIIEPQPISTNGTTLTPEQLLKEFQDESST